MLLLTESYLAQREHWPTGGRHILAQFTEEHVVVYQAYHPGTAAYAVTHQRFGDGFSFNRMSWIKPNFLWMMYRSGWGLKEGQEGILALYMSRSSLDSILSQAVHSSFDVERYPSREAWSRAVASSEVRLQWDPDHDPKGGALPRRAIQLGLRGSVLRSFATDWLIRVEDISPFVAEQRELLAAHPEALVTPRERVLPVAPHIAARVGIEP